ncbi:hypothetical protein ACIBL6_09415 [Streptomyces sp. NPDC050400]|uniref:hypothetical protein n=1 Tax=Streptomyces sp. NPDC050400 TaxID=3365610 RepID=UPI0037AA0397
MHRLKQRLDHSLPAQAVLVFLLGVGISALFRPGEHPALWVIKAALYTAVGITFVAVARRKAGRAAGTDARGVTDLARKIRHREVPEDPAERASMRRLVADQQGRIERGRRRLTYSLGFMGLLAVGMLVLGAVSGSWGFPLLFALGVAVFGVWILWMRRRNLDRLHAMEAALGTDARAHA